MNDFTPEEERIAKALRSTPTPEPAFRWRALLSAPVLAPSRRPRLLRPFRLVPGFAGATALLLTAALAGTAVITAVVVAHHSGPPSPPSAPPGVASAAGTASSVASSPLTPPGSVGTQTPSAPVPVPSGSTASPPATAPAVTPNPTVPPSSCPAGWTCADVGAPALAGSQSVSAGAWTVNGAGYDITLSTDQFRYIWQPSLTTVSARVVSQTNTHPWAKAGVMIREDSSPDSPFYAVYVTPGHGIAVQYRPTRGAHQGDQGHIDGATPPAFLRVSDAGGVFTASTSADGVSWQLISGSTRTLSFNATLGGIAVCSHEAETMGTAVVDSVSAS